MEYNVRCSSYWKTKAYGFSSEMYRIWKLHMMSLVMWTFQNNLWYDSRLGVKSREKPYIGFTQENLMEFQLQSIYLIYTWLMVCPILNLAYPKKHMYYILLIYSIISLCQNLLYPSIIHNHMTVICDILWYHYNPHSESKIKSKIK